MELSVNLQKLLTNSYYLYKFGIQIFHIRKATTKNNENKYSLIASETYMKRKELRTGKTFANPHQELKLQYIKEIELVEKRKT